MSKHLQTQQQTQINNNNIKQKSAKNNIQIRSKETAISKQNKPNKQALPNNKQTSAQQTT